MRVVRARPTKLSGGGLDPGRGVIGSLADTCLHLYNQFAVQLSVKLVVQVKGAGR